MLGSLRGVAAAAAAASLVVATSAAIASPVAHTAATATAAQAPTVDPWLALSAMTGSTSSAEAAVAAQDDNEASVWPPLASLAVILGTIGTAIYILLDDDSSGGAQPISPA